MEGELVVAALVAVVLLALVVKVAAHDRSFDGRFPPISDEEFVARCTPGTTPDVALRVRRIIADRLAVRYEQIHPSMSFIEDIGAD